jgi:hypothetical protein
MLHQTWLLGHILQGGIATQIATEFSGTGLQPTA